MQAIMLAAGKGKRLGKYTKNNTKCMLEINGISLLERAIDALLEANIHSLLLVVGYKKDYLKKYIKKHNLDKKIKITFIDNNDYDSTNNIYSLYMAKDQLCQDDTILLESDLIYEQNIIKKLVNSPYTNAAVVAKYDEWMDGTVVTIDENDNIIEFIEKADFNYSDINKYYKTVNIYKFSKEYLNNYYLPFLEAYIKAYGKNDYYELVLKVISSIPKSGIKAFKINKEKWYEIDDCQDLDIATLFFSSGKQQLELYQKRFGGYWRFKELIDFCYLVNPYFPTQAMIDKMKYNFENLLVDYPSTMSIQSNCISRFFNNVDESKLLVGNGAAELINQLKVILKGKIGIPFPTFNEYVRCLPNTEIVFLNTKENNYQLTKDYLLQYIDKIDALVIINPDNPSGSFIKYEDILEVIDKYNAKNKIIIFDESFIDFAEPELRYTLIDDKILDKYENLIVIKSISKSYGIPGLRLGVLASSNKEFLKEFKDNMPVWNINSFAEYFLQIFVPFSKNYEIACNKICETRKKFIEQLKKLEFIEVYASQANYVMVKLIDMDSQDLTLYLLEKYNLLIKDLSSKKGFDNESFIRIAVKTEKENQTLVDALKKYKEYMKGVK